MDQKPLRTSHLLLRNLRGTPVRTATVLIAVAIVVGLLFSINILTIELQHSTELENARLGADMVILPPLFPGRYSYERANSSISAVGPTSEIRYSGSGYSSQPSFLPGSSVESISHLQGVTRASPQLFAGTLNDSKRESRPLRMIAFDPATDFTVRPWLEPSQNPTVNGDEAIAGGGTGLAVGDELRWKGLTLRVVGQLEATNSSLDQSVFFPLDSAYRAAQAAGTPNQFFAFKPGQVTGVLIELRQGVSANDVAQEIRSHLSDFRAVEASVLARNVGVETSGVGTYGLVVTGVMAIAVIVLITSIFSMTMNERRRELGLLRSLGATRGFIFGSILEEVSIVALVGGVIGLGVGQLVAYFSESYLNEVYKVALIPATTGDLLPSLVVSLIIGVGMGSMASMYPALVATLMDPYDAIRRGE